MKNPKTDNDLPNIRKKAEDVLQRETIRTWSKLSEAEIQKLVHELEVHQIKLEMQNNELRLTHERENILAKKYSEEKYKVLFTNSISVMLVINPMSGDIVDANVAACRFYGWSMSELIKKNISEINTLTLEEVKAEMSKAVDEKRHKFFFRHRLADGEIREVEVNTGEIIIDESKYLLSFITDITDRKRFEKELKKSEGKYRFLVQNSYDIIFSVTAEGIFTFVSDAWTKVLGHPLSNVVGQPIQQFIHPEDLKMCLEYLKRVFDKGEQQLPIEYRVQHFDGSWRWHSSTVTLLNENGLHGTVEGVARDITQRKKSDEDLRKNEIRHKKMISNIGDVIVIIDQEGNNRYKSPNVERLFGWKPEELVGLNALENVHPEDLPSAQLTIRNVFKEPNTRSKAEIRYKCKDGNYKWIEVTVVNLLYDRDIEGILGNYHDITERKETELKLKETEQRLRQSEKMESIGQLAGGIAHDFNNILTGIIGFTEMSQRHAENNPVLNNNLLKVLTASARAKHLIRQILTFSRKTKPEMAITDIKPIVMEVVDLLKASIPSSVKIESDLQIDTKPVLANSTNIHEVILNLASNAVYAMKQKGVLTIRVYSEKIEHLEIVHTGPLEQGEYTVVEVTDTGCGMDSKIILKVFEPFFTTKTVGEGTGMGLSVVFGVVQSCNGSIKVSSMVGKGTTFKIYLPISMGSIPVASNDSVITETTGTERILFVDDEQFLLDMAEMEFSYLGYKIKSVSNSREALEFFKDNNSEIDILITDQTMPGMTGFELAKEVLKIKKDLPIFLCTGFSNTVSPEAAKAAGIREFVEKPYEINAISQLIRKMFDQKNRKTL